MKNIHKINQHIYITNDEDIKEGVEQWYLDKFLNKPMNSGGAQYGEKQNVIILTTDQDLIKDGVQAIDDEFLEWFVKNPSCEEVEVESKITKNGVWTDLKGYVELPTIHSINYKIIIPKEEPKQENCCTPVGQIKRYLNCVGCDRKPIQEILENLENQLKKVIKEHPIDVNEDTYWRGVKIGLQTAVEVIKFKVW